MINIFNNVRNQLHWKWFEVGVVPSIRIDAYPTLLRFGGLSVILFELSFIALVWHRRTRLVALALGLGFHASTRYFMHIPFMSLWAAYVVLVDWGRLLDWTRGHDSTAVVRQTTARGQALWASVVASAVIVPMAIVQGARGKTEAWPFACYPTFQWVVGDRLPDVEMTFIDEHGTEGAPHRLPRGRSNAEWSLAWRAAGAYFVPATDAELRGYATWAAAKGGFSLPSGSRIRFYKIEWSVAPEAKDDGPVSRSFLREL